ncbi:MAG: polysaccharide biosynthesis/export family protein [Verrucomicrobiales bacterium]
MKKHIATICLVGASLLGSPDVGAQDVGDYKIASQDVIVIDVLGEKDLSKDFRVSSSGTIRYPWLGTIEVKGRTTSQVEEYLTEALDKDYLVKPQVTVAIKEYRTREVFVNGPVTKPGSVILPGEQDLTILDAIGRAGGLTARANEKKIKWSRGRIEKNFTLEELKRETDKDKIIKLEPGDVIEVADKLF